MQPHRGVMILIFGILGIICCFGFGIAAWVLGNQDKAAMRAGTMDRSGEGMTDAGRIIGIISVAWAIFGTILGVVLFSVGMIGTATHGGFPH